MDHATLKMENILPALISMALKSANIHFWFKPLSSNKYAYISPSLVQIATLSNKVNLMEDGPWKALISIEEQQRLTNNYIKVLRKQLDKGRHAFKILTQDKSSCWFEEEFFLIEEPVSGEMYMAGIARDITEIVNREEELHEASIYFTKLAEKSEDVFWVRDAYYKQQIYVSPSFETVWGRSMSELYNSPERWASYLYPEDKKRLAEKISGERNVHTDPEGKFYENYRIVRPNGELRYIVDCSFPIYSRQNVLIGFAGIARDVTEQIRYEQILQEAKEQAEAADKAKSEFLLNMSHDLCSPFSVILSMTRSLYDDEKNPVKKEMQGLVTNSARRLYALLTDILEIAKLGSHPISYSQFNINDVVEEVSQLISAEMKMKGLELNTICPAALINIDKHRITRILLNLVGNAIKFTHTGSITIEITVGSELQLIVQDSGIGIPQDKLEAIFEKFRKLSPSNEHKTYMGSGLGLYIVKQFVDDLKGGVTVESELHKGSRFKVTIPLTQAVG